MLCPDGHSRGHSRLLTVSDSGDVGCGTLAALALPPRACQPQQVPRAGLHPAPPSAGLRSDEQPRPWSWGADGLGASTGDTHCDLVQQCPGVSRRQGGPS